MNTIDLAAAYQRLIAAAQALSDDSPLNAGQRADLGWTLCHVALSDQILTEAARQVRCDGPETTGKLVVDNRPALDPAAIAAMTAATTHQDRIAAVRKHAASLTDELDQTPDQAAQAPVILRFHDRSGKHVGDTAMTWADLIELRTHQHIPAHATRLASYLPPESE
ncbi:MAG: hypothetical protein M0027_02540 [Candidatus Dormibacteraeota bacterium]|jgi:hypothetical protein|nr:hypothetical protein [Candidatus Dormibacteraeota bacterium]